MNRLICLIAAAVLFLLPQMSYAAFTGYLINHDGDLIELNFTNYSINKIKKLAGLRYVMPSRSGTAVDKVASKIFVIKQDRVYQYVNVYDLNSFELIKTIEGIYSGRDLNVLVNETRNEVYVNWWKDGADRSNSQQVLSIINATTLQVMDEIYGINRTENILLSNNSNSVFYIQTNKPDFHVGTFSLVSKMITGTIDISNRLSNEYFGRGVQDYKNGFLLITENIKKNRSDSNNYTLQTYNIQSNEISGRINTNTQGDGFLLHDGKTAILYEEKKVGEPFNDYVKTGNLLFYDMLTATLSTTLNVAGYHYGQFLGQTPDNKYLLIYIANTDIRAGKVHVINLESRTIDGTFNLIDNNGAEYIFYKDEPDEVPAQ